VKCNFLVYWSTQIIKNLLIMRLQSTPLVLCLFIAFISMLTPINTIANTAETPTSYSTLAHITQKTIVLNTPTSLGSLKAKTPSTVFTFIDADGISGNSSHKSEKKVFSYKFVSDSYLGSSSLTHDAYQNSSGLFNQGMFYGFSLMIILLNIVCFFMFEEQVFLYYALAMLGMTMVLFFGDNILGIYNITLTQNPTALQTTLLFIAIGLNALFASQYLSIKEVFPKLNWIALTLIGISSLFVFGTWLFTDIFFVQIATILLFAVMSLYFVAGIVLFSKKNYPKFFVIAFAIPLLFGIDYFVLNPLDISFLLTQSFHIKAAILIEMLILTYAIMFRMKAIKEENILRQTEMRIFLKRQEEMNREKAEKLMEEVYLENLIMHYDLDGFEIKLLQYISEGKSNEKIARKLNTTLAEIEEQTKELYIKLEIGEQIQEDYRMIDSQPDYIYN